jgi:hypothetical protein
MPLKNRRGWKTVNDRMFISIIIYVWVRVENVRESFEEKKKAGAF